MSEEQKEATVVFNDKKIPMSQLSFQTQRNMQRLSQLQNRVSDLQEQLAEAQVLLKDYGSKVNAALEEAASRGWIKKFLLRKANLGKRIR